MRDPSPPRTAPTGHGFVVGETAGGGAVGSGAQSRGGNQRENASDVLKKGDGGQQNR